MAGRQYNGIREFENRLGIGFAPKFYPYINAFMDDLESYVINEGTKFIPAYVINKILKNYGDFTFNDL